MTRSLRLQDVYAGYGAMRIINGVSLEVGKDEVLALLGTNGSGKSTLLKTILNLATLQRGSIQWDGEDIANLSTWERVRRGLGYLPQGQNVFPSLTTEENLAIAAARGSLRHGDIDLASIYDLFPELARLGSTMAGKLSGGERRMLAFAATLMQEPKMLILDEPTGDLAPTMIDRMFEVIAQVRERQGLPLLLVEQNVSRALDIADRVCILRRGSVVLDRPSADVSEAELVAHFMEHGSGIPSDVAGWVVADEG